MARILCVEDESAVLRLLDTILSRAGHECVPARHVAEALHILRQGGVDVIISDFQLPGIDGLEFITMLRREGDRTPFIMITAHGGVDHAMSAVRAGADEIG